MKDDFKTVKLIFIHAKETFLRVGVEICTTHLWFLIIDILQFFAFKDYIEVEFTLYSVNIVMRYQNNRLNKAFNKYMCC